MKLEYSFLRGQPFDLVRSVRLLSQQTSERRMRQNSVRTGERTGEEARTTKHSTAHSCPDTPAHANLNTKTPYTNWLNQRTLTSGYRCCCSCCRFYAQLHPNPSTHTAKSATMSSLLRLRQLVPRALLATNSNNPQAAR